MPFAPVKHIDEELVRQIAMGNAKAYKELFNMYYKRLCQFAFLFIRSVEITEEVVLDVFINMWIKRDQLVQIRNIRSFLYTSVRNQAIDYQRSKTVDTQDYLDVYKLEVKDTKPAVDDMIDLELFRERAQKAFELLPERCRMITRM